MQKNHFTCKPARKIFYEKLCSGFTLLEVAIVILILGIIALIAIPRFFDLYQRARQAAESGMVGMIRAGISTYHANALVNSHTQVFPPQLDSAMDGNASSSNVFFTMVLSQPVYADWSKQGPYYTGPAGNQYVYYPAQGVFGYLQTIPGGNDFWSMEEGSGSIVNDPFGKVNGTVNGATWTAGKVGSALEFNGTSNYVSIPDNNSLQLTEAGTVMAWIYAEGPIDAFGGIVHKGNVSNFSDEAYSLQFWPNGSNRRIRLYVGDAAGNHQYVEAPVDIQTGQWYHVAASWDSSGMKIYINGVLSNSNNISTVAMNSSGPLFIGTQLSGNYRYKGTIDEVGLFNRAVSAGEIQAYYSSTNGS